MSEIPRGKRRPIQIFDCDQNSPEWLECRRGIPTASMFSTVLARGKDGGGSATSKTRKEYLYKLAGEIITGELVEGYSNAHMERGHEHEPIARATYGFIHDCEPLQVGFVRRDRAGASPDSLLGEEGLLEIKSKLPHRLIEAMLRGSFPPEHRAQVQGQLLVAEREWCDIAIYWPGLPLVTYRAWREETYIADLESAIDAFNEELDQIVERVRAYGDPGALRRSLEQSVAAERAA